MSRRSFTRTKYIINDVNYNIYDVILPESNLSGPSSVIVSGTDSEGVSLVQRSDVFCAIGVYGIAHALVDASCASLVFFASATGRLTPASAAATVLVYNLLAFASQPLLGWFLVDVRPARVWARVGAGLVAGAFLMSLVPGLLWPAVLITGIGNAVFHLGGGVMSLRAEPGRATLPGLFVAPGAAGLAAGIWLGSSQTLAWLPAVMLVALVPLLGIVEPGSSCAAVDQIDTTTLPVLAIGILFAVVALRSFIGGGVVFPWKSDPALLWALTAAVVAGKAAGGVLADRFGRAAIGVGALVLSVPLLMAGPSWALGGIAGMLLFNMTMPVTLVAMADAMPARPGFAFGLTCLALILGGMPTALHLSGGLGVVASGTGVLVSAALLWMGLHGDRPVPSGLGGLDPDYGETR